MKPNHLIKLFAFCLAFNSAQASAAILEQKLSVLTSVEYDTNPSLASSNVKSVWRFTANPTYTASLSDDINRWFTTAGMSLQRSSDSAISESRRDPSLAVGWEHQLEKGFFNVTAEYTKTSSRFNEFVKNGVIDKDGSAATKSISATWSRSITDRLDLSVAGQYLKTDYSRSGFSNYNTKSINSSLTYQLNEKVSPFVQVGISDLSSEANGVQSGISQSYLTGAKIEISPNFNLSASVGLNHRKDAGNALVANTLMTYLAEKYNLQGSFSRNVSPSGLGQYQETDNLALKYIYYLSDKENVGSDFGWSNNGTAGGSIGSKSSNNAMQISAWYSKEISDAWLMKFNLNLKQLNNGSQSANARIFGISLTYNTPGF